MKSIICALVQNQEVCHFKPFIHFHAKAVIVKERCCHFPYFCVCTRWLFPRSLTNNVNPIQLIAPMQVLIIETIQEEFLNRNRSVSEKRCFWYKWSTDVRTLATLSMSSYISERCFVPYKRIVHWHWKKWHWNFNAIVALWFLTGVGASCKRILNLNADTITLQ